MAETQCSNKIKIFRSDNGTEYTNNSFQKFLNSCGIIHQRTAPYTPEQNGVSERLNRTIIDRVRCMLIDSGLDEKFWAEAAVTASYLLNRTPCRNHSVCPEEMWSGRKPSLNHIRVFGCKAFMHIPKVKRSKLEPKSIPCIFVGYSLEAKAYRLYDPVTRKMNISRDVVFMEDQVRNNEVDLTNNFPNLVVGINGDDVDSVEELYSALQELPSETKEEQISEEMVNVSTDSLKVEYDGNSVAGLNFEDAFEEQYEETLSVEKPEVRRSERIAVKSAKEYNFCATSFVTNDPMTVKEALNSKEAKQWQAAMDLEINSLALNDTWSLVEPFPDNKPIKCKWIFKTKYDASGNKVCHKARLVVQGCSQQKGVNYDETFAPVVRYSSIRFLLALSVKFNLHVHQLDAVTAFLNGDLQEEIYMEQPNGYKDGTNRVCQLKKALYGLKQSSRVWNTTLNNVLLKFALKRSNTDQCVYYNTDNDGILYVAIYVDDLLIFSNDINRTNKLKSELSKHFRMKDLGEAHSVLGMRIQKSNGSIKVDQIKYIEEVLKRFSMYDCNPVCSPVDVNQKLSLDMCPKTDKEKEEMKNVPYMEAVGCLLYAAQNTRPDICYIVNMLSRFNNNPGKAHWSAVKRVMRYLKGTINKGLVYDGKSEGLVGYCDADWAGSIDDRRSTTGYIFTMQGAAVSWGSKRQRTVALSSTEAELMSIVSAIQESIWLRKLERELVKNSPDSMNLYCDNKSAIQIAQNNSYSSRTKHIDIRAKFIREKLESGEIKLEFLESKKMLADIFTKGVPADVYKNFVVQFGLV